MSTSTGKYGRPKCAVWKYFSFDEQTGKSTCIVKLKQRQDDEDTGLDTLCNKEFKGKFTSNLKLHLKKEHLEEYKLLEEEKKKREQTVKRSGKSKSKRSSSSSLFQPTLSTIASQKMPYDPHSIKQKSITKKLAVFAGASNVPISLVENAEFQELLCELDSRYQMPGRFKIAKELDMLYSNLKENHRKSLDSAERISLCADIWSKKGMTAFF